MTLPASGPMSISMMAAEFGVALPCVFPRDFYGKPGIPASGPLKFSDFYGKSNVVFTPNGGEVYDYGSTSASVILVCNQSAIWTYTGGGGTVSRASGTAGNSITFSVSSPAFSYRSANYAVSATAMGVTRSFTVTLEAGNA